jgi:predicted enzyme related to lactoylglutathione lyase
MANLLVWADLPVKDMARARAFYSRLLGYDIPGFPGMEDKMALLMRPGDPDTMAAGVDLAADAPTRPSTQFGPVIYLSANGDIDGMLERAVQAGGSVHAPKKDFGQFGGWLAYIVDTEGNLIGLQQPSGTSAG